MSVPDMTLLSMEDSVRQVLSRREQEFVVVGGNRMRSEIRSECPGRIVSRWSFTGRLTKCVFDKS